MKILLVAPTPPPMGGMAVWTENYIEELNKNKNFDVYLINTAEINKSNFKIINELIRNITIIWRVIICKSVDVAHVCTPCHNIGIFRDLLICEVLLLKKIPYIFHIHSNLKEFISDSELSQNALNFCLKHAKKIIVLNRNAFDYVKYSNKVIINNFIDIEKMQQYVKENQEKEISKICFVGHFKNEKGSLDYEEIASRLPKIDFYVFGRMFDKPTRELSNLKMCGNLERNRLFNEMKKMDLLLFVSHHEGSPLTVVEAASLKLPVISTDVGDVKEKLTEDCIVKVGDISAIINKIHDFSNVEKRIEIAEKNFNNCLEFDSAKIIRNYIACYEGK